MVYSCHRTRGDGRKERDEGEGRRRERVSSTVRLLNQRGPVPRRSERGYQASAYIESHERVCTCPLHFGQRPNAIQGQAPPRLGDEKGASSRYCRLLASPESAMYISYVSALLREAFGALRPQPRSPTELLTRRAQAHSPAFHPTSCSPSLDQNVLYTTTESHNEACPLLHLYLRVVEPPASRRRVQDGRQQCFHEVYARGGAAGYHRANLAR